MAYNTGNAIGSNDPRDLFDNAGNLDKLVNGPAQSYPDRLGVSRKSWAGMEADFQAFLLASGYQFLGDYAAALTLTARNQIIRYSGEYYRAAAATALPYTLTGTWATDSPYLVSVGDAVLRQDLAEPTGSGIVGTPDADGAPSSVGTELAALRGRADILEYRDRNFRNLVAAWRKFKFGTITTVVCVGDSLTIGYDVTSPGVIPSDDGFTKAPVQYPQAAQSLCSLYTGVGHSFINRGWSGDTAKKSYERWLTDPNADAAHIMLGINDANGVDGATFDEYMLYMELLIRRYINWGCGVVINTVTPETFNSYQDNAVRFSQAARRLADIYGCPIFETDTCVQYALYNSVYSDIAHFTAYGYHKLGNAVAAFIMAGGWVQPPKMVRGEMHLHVGQDTYGVGITSRGATFAANPLGYLSNLNQGVLLNADDRISYTFFQDCELMEVYAVGYLDGLTAELSYVLNPTYLGDPRGPGSINRMSTNILRNRGIDETTGYTVQAGRAAATGAPAKLGKLVGRGWKTVSLYASSTFGSGRILSGLILQERRLTEVGDSADSGSRMSVGESSVLVYQYPYPAPNGSSSSAPTAAALPSAIVMPAPWALMPYVAGPSAYYDALPVEVDIQGSEAGEWARVMLRRTASSGALEVNQIAVGAAGSALVPTSANLVHNTYDPGTGAPSGTITLGVGDGGSLQVTHLQLGFGSTPAGHYKIIVRDDHKPGMASAI